MQPEMPFYGAPAPAMPWPPRPDATGVLPFLSPHAQYNADVEFTIGGVIPPACPTQPGLAAARWGPHGPRLFPDVDPDAPPDYLVHTAACWTISTSALVGNFTRHVSTLGVPDPPHRARRQL